MTVETTLADLQQTLANIEPEREALQEQLDMLLKRRNMIDDLAKHLAGVIAWYEVAAAQEQVNPVPEDGEGD